MKFLWVNNVGSVIGGTMACTLSMVRSLPDAEHTVFTFGRFGDTEYKAFPQGVKLVSGSNLRDFIGSQKFDVIVFQNTAIEAMPNTYVNRPLLVYYQHSNHRSGKQARERCDITFCVSKYLADLAGLSCDDVLYQPVTIPPRVKDESYDERTKRYPFVIGRICTPNPNKWRKEDVIDLYHQIMEHREMFDDKVGFHFVGASDPVKEELFKYPNCLFSPPSFEARGYLHEWDCYLYKSQLKETYGRVVKEAQRCGCVPIVSNQGGFREQIDSGVTGYLCDTEREFVSAVEYTFKGEIKPAELGKYGDSTGGLKVFRDEFLRRLANYCSV